MQWRKNEKIATDYSPDSRGKLPLQRCECDVAYEYSLVKLVVCRVRCTT